MKRVFLLPLALSYAKKLEVIRKNPGRHAKTMSVIGVFFITPGLFMMHRKPLYGG
jgi:hypothetical protein